MGQKVHPESMRVGYIHDWKSNWFNEKNFDDFLIEDVRIRDHITNKLAHAGLSDITIRKDAAEVEVNIHTARPGIVIGKSGSEVDALRRDLHRLTGKAIKVNILEIKRPELDAKLVAQSIAEQLQNRVAFRRAMKRALTSAMRSGAKGCKIQVSGRLGGAEMARTEQYNDGRVPLHTLRADIDYGFYEARTTFGRIGVKCWINKGEIMPEGYSGQDLTSLDEPAQSGRGDDDDRRGGRGRRDGRGRAAAGATAAAAAVVGRAVPAVRGGARRWRPRRRWRWRRRWPRRRWRWPRRRRSRRRSRWPRRRASGSQWRDQPLMLSPKRVKFRKQHRGRRHGMSRGQQTVEFGEYGLKSLEAGWLTNRQIEAARIAHDPQDQAWRQGLDQRLSRQAVHQEAGRDPHGLRQGQPRGLGRRRQARPRDVRAVRRARAARPRGDAPGRPQAARQDQVRPARGPARMTARELRDFDDESLLDRIATARRDLFGLRLQHATGELENTAGLRAAKRELARALTVARERGLDPTVTTTAETVNG